MAYTYLGSGGDLVRRALAAYYRAGHRDGLADNQIAIPGNSSHLCELDGRQYVVLHNISGVLAVYRVRTSGNLKGLRRWPRELETW